MNEASMQEEERLGKLVIGAASLISDRLGNMISW
jgi:hypothetical protein